MRLAFMVVALCGLVAFGLIFWAYLTPMTGITGTSGAALAAFGGAMVALGGVLKALLSLPRGLGATLNVLLFLGILGTGVAAYFLMQFPALAAMAVAMLALFAGLATQPGETRRAVSA